MPKKTPDVFLDLWNGKRLRFFSLSLAIKLNTLAAIFPGNKPALYFIKGIIWFAGI